MDNTSMVLTVPASHRTKSSAAPSCADCHVVPSLTSECTDQCVVVACSDEDAVCRDSHCDLVCEDASNCQDCNGFDEFLQCCTDFHSYYEEPRNNPESWNWDPSLKTFVCSCGGGSTLDCVPPGGIPMLDDTSVPMPPVEITPVPTPPPSSPSPSSVFADSQSPSLSCMWGDCGAPFATLAELAEHVNVVHLGHPLSAPVPPHPDPFAMACLWKDCTVYPTPDLIPGPSSGDVDSMLCRLSSHLLHDHLGMNIGPCRHPQAHGWLPSHSPAVSSETTTPDLENTMSCRNPQAHGWLASQAPAVPSETTTPNFENAGPCRYPQAHGWLASQAPAVPSELTTPGFESCHCPLNTKLPIEDALELSPASTEPSPPLPDTNPVGYGCEWSLCGQRFPSLDELTKHLTDVHVGSGKTSYDCYWGDCQRHGENGFTSKQKLCRHLQSHTGFRPFTCKVCNQNFSEAATLQQHMRRHTQEKPYSCDVPGCGKSFAIAGALTIHKRTHSGSKPFKCPSCDKAFSESSNLSKHMRIHTGLKPYCCDVCNKSFARADQLTRHTRVHNKKPPNV
ncbi:hypothetical protein R3P38DRAFT_3394149 [Favolaschia claudopus]|uniref:C2H2-type domain-containing protein n=1 Tax=Favolaschia claudopus TaxID=2862362 RepID=A0AAW0BVF7_9AGAR